MTRKYSRRRNQIRIKRLLFAVEKRKNYHTLYGKLLQGLHVAESIFEGHLRDKSWSRLRFSVKNLHQSSHAVTIITNTNSTISTMSTFVNSQANLIFGHFQRAVSTSQQPQLSENLNRYQVVATLRYHQKLTSTKLFALSFKRQVLKCIFRSTVFFLWKYLVVF